MKSAGLAAVALAMACASPALAADSAPRVVASIKPVYSLVSAVMAGVGTPSLLVEGAGSPHTYSMRPSQAAGLAKADVVFWIGPDLEHFLEKPIGTLGAGARAVELEVADGVTRLDPREGGTFEPEDEHEHGGEHADEHGDEHADEHGGEETIDPHLWLDPLNAKAFVRRIAETLAVADPAHAQTYAENAKAEQARLDALIAEITKTLEPVKGKGFIVFHDAYHYFENRFGVTAAGSITVSPETSPGAQRLAEVRAKIRELGATCVFSEPEFESSLVGVVLEGSQARSGVLDPLGAALADGPDLYFELLRNLAASMRDCLAG